MKAFSIYEHPAYGNRVAVKIGWSWPAFFFGIFWLLAKKMWAYAAIFFIVFFTLGFIEGYNDGTELARALDVLINALNILTAVALGYFGNRIYVHHLENTGYEKVADMVIAPNPDAALAEYVKGIRRCGSEN